DMIGGYPNIRFLLTEDLALLQAVMHAGYEARYICAKETQIYTVPCPDIRSFIKQHHRWVNGGKALGWRAAAFVASSVALWMAILVSCITASWFMLVIVLAVRMIANIMLALPAYRELGIATAVLWLPLAEPFFLLVEFMMPFLGLQSKVEWKGQMLQNH
ncbi:MAG: glycosyltransferase family 2 protein, partial [Bacteroidota bacterium]|nr:hypothetical protein [Candidatus Kapabacteria bacterium]MDW8221276.1 glycosyltransferase family 2 protein [Bacteroidota bacterium]